MQKDVTICSNSSNKLLFVFAQRQNIRRAKSKGSICSLDTIHSRAKAIISCYNGRKCHYNRFITQDDRFALVRVHRDEINGGRNQRGTKYDMTGQVRVCVRVA